MPNYEMQMSAESFKSLIDEAPFAAGQSRAVYGVPSDSGVVVKTVKNGFPGPNIIEWHIWHQINDTTLGDTFGRCISISRCGQYLMMERLRDVVAGDAPFPTIPDWLTDRKRSAFGVDYNGKVKIRDYGTLKLGSTLESAPRVDLPL
nr:hypothetical protein [Brevundimonas diminuta]